MSGVAQATRLTTQGSVVLVKPAVMATADLKSAKRTSEPACEERKLASSLFSVPLNPLTKAVAVAGDDRPWPRGVAPTSGTLVTKN